MSRSPDGIIAFSGPFIVDATGGGTALSWHFSTVVSSVLSDFRIDKSEVPYFSIGRTNFTIGSLNYSSVFFGFGAGTTPVFDMYWNTASTTKVNAFTFRYRLSALLQASLSVAFAMNVAGDCLLSTDPDNILSSIMKTTFIAGNAREGSKLSIGCTSY